MTQDFPQTGSAAANGSPSFIKIQPERAPILDEFQMKRNSLSSECFYSTSVLFYGFSNLLFSSYQHKHTQTCLFCLKTPKMFKTRVCRKKRLRMEELIKQEQQDVWSHSFMVRLVQLQNICNKHTGLHSFSQTAKESFVRFSSRLWGHTYVNTLFKLWMLVGADVSWFTSSNLYLVPLYLVIFPMEWWESEQEMRHGLCFACINGPLLFLCLLL